MSNICAALISRQLSERTALRLALPSKGRMAEDTIELLRVRPPSHYSVSSLRCSRYVASNYSARNAAC